MTTYSITRVTGGWEVAFDSEFQARFDTLQAARAYVRKQRYGERLGKLCSFVAPDGSIQFFRKVVHD